MITAAATAILALAVILLSVTVMRYRDQLTRAQLAVLGVAERVARLETAVGIHEPRCRVCGCTDDEACTSWCFWVEEDLCSSCADDIDAGAGR